MFAINEPCHENWDDMSPSEKGRHCAVCEKQVVDFTALDPEQGLAMLEAAARDANSCSTGICGRVRADDQGRLQLSTELVSAASKPRRRYLSDALAGMFALSVMGGCYAEPEVEQTQIETQKPVQQPVDHPVLMGEVICEPPPHTPTVKGEIHYIQGDIEYIEPQKD